MSESTSRPRSSEEPRVVAALLGLLAVLGLYAFLQSPFFALAELDVQGTVTIPPEEIAALAGLRPGDNLLTVDMRELASVIALHPRVERAAIQRRLPGKLVITVVEHEPLLLVELDEGVIALSRDGSEIPFSPQEAARLPLVQGELDTVRRTFLTLSAMMPVDMHAHVAEMYVQDGTITLRGRAGETVLLGDATNLVKKVDIAADLLRQRRYMVIDVRFPSSPTVRTGE